MSVQFDTALVDLIAMRRYVRTHARGAGLVRLLLHLAMLFIIFSICFVGYYSFQFEWPQMLILLVMLALVYRLVVRAGTDDRAAVTSALQRGLHPGTLGPTMISLENDCLVVQRLVRSERIAWAGFVGIAQTHDHLILFESDLVAVVVPRRAFESPADFARFADEARRLHAPSRR